MQQTTPQRATSRRMPLRRYAATAIAAGVLGAPLAALVPAGAATHTATKLTVSTTKNAKLGTILVSTRTLYTLQPSKTPCTGKCLKIWPPLLLPKGVSHATAGPGVSAAKLGTVHTKSGLQVTYGGKALYFYVGDHAAGQANGNITDSWGKWAAVVTVKAHHSSGSSGSGSTSTGSGSGGSNTGTGGVAF